MNGEPKHFKFLAKLRDGGKVNMWGAAPYLEVAFKLSRNEARDILLQWIKSFDKDATP